MRLLIKCKFVLHLLHLHLYSLHRRLFHEKYSYTNHTFERTESFAKEIHTAPIISSWVWYRVGSRDEVQGRTGVSHWVEHMQFKGTQQFPANVLDKSISREGGTWNAFTYIDWTAYFETMPADKIDLALRLESDRMVNSQFRS